MSMFAQDPKTKHYAWEGTMGENITFRLELEKASNGLIIGETTYFRKNGKISDIPVYGRFCELEDGNELVLSEYNVRTECGTIIIMLDSKGNFESGEWSHGDKSYELNNMKAVPFSFGKHQTFLFPVSGERCNGEYGFSYKTGNPNMPEYGGYASLKVIGNMLKWEMNQVTPNIAEGNGKSLYKGNTFSGKAGDFKFNAYTYRDCLYVVCTNPENAPFNSFGNNATLEGIYIKHPSKKK